MKKSLTALVLLIAGLMVVGRVVNSADDAPLLLKGEIIEEAVVMESETLFEEPEPFNLPEVEEVLSIEDVVEAAVEEAVENLEPVPTVEEQQAQEATDQLIKIGAERDLDQGIEVVSEDQGADLITLTLDDVPLQDVVRMFTRISGANIVAGTNLQGSVTVSLRDVEWRPALDVILDSVDMALIEKKEGIFTIMSRRDLASEPVVADIIILQFVTVSNVMPVVQGMLSSSNASATAVVAANAIAIQETVERLGQIKQIVKQIDKPRPQVFIEAKFVELNDSYTKDIGIDWEVLRGYSVTASGLNRTFDETFTRQRQNAVVDLGSDFNQQSSTFSSRAGRELLDGSTGVDGFSLADGIELSDRTSSSADRTFGEDSSSSGNSASSRNRVNLTGGNFESFQDGEISAIPTYFRQVVQSSILSADDFTLTLSALEDNSAVSVVSNPKVIVANGETAIIHVGRNQPNIVAVPTGDTGDRFAYTLDDENPFIEIGVKVNVTPQVNTESNITVKIVPELSRLLGFQEVGVAGVSFPITQIRKIITEFNLASGYTVAIGGLTETSDSDKVKKIPLLGDIPIIGKYLFSSTSVEKLQDEVVIFVTVGLANPDSLVEVTGVPSRSRLIHKHLAQEALMDQEQD